MSSCRGRAPHSLAEDLCTSRTQRPPVVAGQQPVEITQLLLTTGARDGTRIRTPLREGGLKPCTPVSTHPPASVPSNQSEPQSVSVL
jgi:hypothetical protein